MVAERMMMAKEEREGRREWGGRGRKREREREKERCADLRPLGQRVHRGSGLEDGGADLGGRADDDGIVLREPACWRNHSLEGSIEGLVAGLR